MAKPIHAIFPIHDLGEWPSDLVFATLEELTDNLDAFLDQMEGFLEAQPHRRAAQPARESRGNH
jgi:hypothetical protein